MTTIPDRGPAALVLGAYLRSLRLAEGIKAAEAMRGSEAKPSRMETGQVAQQWRDVAALVRVYGMTDSSTIVDTLRWSGWHRETPSTGRTPSTTTPKAGWTDCAPASTTHPRSASTPRPPSRASCRPPDAPWTVCRCGQRRPLPGSRHTPCSRTRHGRTSPSSSMGQSSCGRSRPRRPWQRRWPTYSGWGPLARGSWWCLSMLGSSRRRAPCIASSSSGRRCAPRRAGARSTPPEWPARRRVVVWPPGSQRPRTPRRAPSCWI
ncbi:helix-turn-helix domain-containing protein [Streptomyces rapamycinicus]|uniref:Helix-turn-helix domain-containing protein n=1 Tax=Streptomyces rhizosphaericus TaxID=114699 RepID=A0A6G4AP45_9ACTN|nr:helix-turn-helix domain-containing protein [Streptomyces rhizosphaericus]